MFCRPSFPGLSPELDSVWRIPLEDECELELHHTLAGNLGSKHRRVGEAFVRTAGAKVRMVENREGVLCGARHGF